jgi:hypothetical protein
MYYTEVDKTGKIVRSQFVENPDIDTFRLLSETNRLVADQSPNPPEYDPTYQYAERQEPVLGDKVEYVIKQVPGAVKKEPDAKIAADLIIANQFAQQKGIQESFVYSLTNYNVTTKQDIANLFGAGKYLIKVANNQVSEFYEANVLVNGTKYVWVSRDVQTNEIIDKYLVVSNALEKYTPDTTAEPVRTITGGYDTIPERLKPLLEDFPYKQAIQLWSVKSYGFIVEYRKQ